MDLKEKTLVSVTETEELNFESSEHVNSNRKKVDEALNFITENDMDSEFELSEDQMKKLRWKIDLRIMPILMIIYFLQYLDKTLLNYAAVMGIKKNLVGNQFSNLGTIFYVGYIVAEPFSGYLLQKFPAAYFIGINVTCWGIVVSLHAATKTYAGLMVIRTLLGVFEASVANCLISITGMWWRKDEQSRRTGLWYLQIGVAQIIGSLISFGFQHVVSTTIANWQILFIFMGVLTFLFGLLTIFFLPNNPMSANFLNSQEKRIAIEHIRVNQTGVENKTFKMYQVKELLFKDKQTWLLFFITVLAMIDNGAVSNFSSIIISTFGYSNEKTTILQIPSGVVSIVATFCCCFLSASIGFRSYIICLVCIPSILGAILLLALDNSQKVGKLVGVYLLNFCPAMLPMIYNWNSVNTSGYTKRVMRNALTLIAFCIGNIIGPQMFQSGDFPNYTPAKIALIISMSLVILLTLLLRSVVVRENKKRDNEAVVMELKDIEFLDLTDIENKNFRYVY